MKKLKIKIWLAIFMLTFAHSIFAQEGLTIIDSSTTGSIKFALIDENSKLKEQPNSVQFLKTILKANNKTSFYLYRTTTDELGYTHEAYQQIFDGIKVEFAEYIVHRDKNGYITSINGNFEVIPENFKINPESTFEEIFTRMSLKRDSKQYQILDLPQSVKPQNSKIRQSNQTEMVIIRGDKNKFHLTHKTNLIGSDITDNFLGYLDSKTGDIVFKQPLVYQANVTGNATTRYSGSRSIVTDSYSGKYRLREVNRGGTTTAIHTRNFNNVSHQSQQQGINNATEFYDNDNNWTAAEFNNSKKDNAALDAHWGAEITFDYFLSVHNHKSYDNKNAPINNYVHVGSSYDNAFWSGSYKAMFYGDGNRYSPLVSLDVIAHEIGHGVCNASVGNGTGLVYKGESGALNESLSDIWAACVENKYAPEKQTWVMAEDISQVGGMRSMNNPKSYGDPNTYGGQYWANTDPNASDYGGVHTNSGVGNHWFYLLSEGGNGRNDLGNNYGVIGIGILKAAKIVYRMETTNLLNSKSGYLTASIAAITAAKQLYGDSSIEAISVQNAWHAVGIGTPLPYGKISAPSVICNNSTSNFTLSNLPQGATIIWTGDSKLTLVSGQGAKTATFKAGTGNGYSTVSATVKVGTQSFDAVSPKVLVGIKVGVKHELGQTHFTQGATYMFVAETVGAGSSSVFKWSSSGRVVSSSSSSAIVQVPSSGSFYVTCEVNSQCGTASGTFRGGTYNPNKPGGPMYPEKSLPKPRIVEVYSYPIGQLVYKGIAEDFDINNLSIPDGIYIVNTKDKDGSNAVSEKIMKKVY